MDPTTLIFQLAFCVLFAVSLWRFIRRPGPLELSVLAVFTAFVSLFVLTTLNTLAPAVAPVFRPLLIPILFLQPYLVLRLADQIQPVRRAIKWSVLAGAVASTIALLALPRDPRATIPAVAFFFVAQTVAALAFAVASRRRYGLARVRLALVAIATAFFGGAILITGIASAFARGGPTPTGATQAATFVAFLAAAGYVLAFLSPSSVRRFAYRAVAFDLVRALVAPPVGTDSGRLWEQYAATAREILGAHRVVVEAEAGGARLAAVGVGDEPARLEQDLDDVAPLRDDAVDRHGPVSRIEVRVRSTPGPSEQLVAEIEGRPLFVEDDVALLQLLGSLTARAVDREGALIGLGEAKRAIEESTVLRASEARFRALLEADPNAVLALDEAGKVTWATRQAGELFGASAEALVGADISDLVVLLADAGAPRGAANRSVFRAETTGRRIDGTRFPAEIARADFELDGRPFQLAVISDVTWRHEADQIRERFLGVLSHELRTPVTSIYGGTQLLLGRGARLDPATRAELLVGVAAESERLQRMIENLVAMARIERGAEYGGPRPVLVDRIIKSLVERERALWPEVSIHLASSGPVSMVAADEEYLAQIMRNLLSNAAKYGGPGSTVEVLLVDGRDEVQILVRDDGPGINPEDAEKLFNLYYRAAPQAATAPGAGIGLFVCHELVGLMGGRIWAKNRPEGGSEFGFTLPTYEDELEPAYAEAAPDRQPTPSEPTTVPA